MSDAPMLLLTPAETARLLRVSRSSIYRLIQRNELPVVRVGGVVRVHRAALTAWLDAQLENGTGEEGTTDG
jgi:excisionase family DNA binding protein